MPNSLFDTLKGKLDIGKIHTRILQPVVKTVMLAKQQNFINTIPSYPQDNKTVTYDNRRFGLPHFRIKKRGGGAGIPENDAFWFEKKENEVILHFILEAYREEEDVYPLCFNDIKLNFNYKKNGSSKSIPLRITGSTSVGQINVFKDTQASATIPTSDVQNVIESISSNTGLDATIIVNSTIHWQKPSTNTPTQPTRQNYTGTWKTNHGPLRLVQIGDKVYGDYVNVNGTIQGSIKNNVLNGIFTNRNNRGKFQFSINSNKFAGQWAWANNSGKGHWNGTRISAAKPNLTSAIKSRLANANAKNVFRHTSKVSNIKANQTIINNSLINGRADKALFIDNVYGQYLPDPVGVWFNGKKWTIYKQNKKAMPANLSFNVLVKSVRDKNVFIHIATAANTNRHITTLNHPLTNNNPNAKILISQAYGAYNNNPVGIYYSGGKWRIFNQNMKPLPVKCKFNILVNPSGAFQHISNSKNHITPLNHARAKNNQSYLFTTQLWKGVYNPHTVGLWYSGGKWNIYNEDRAALPSKTMFNVLSLSGRNNTTASKPQVNTAVSKPNKVNHQFTLNLNYQKNDPSVFGQLIGSFIREEYKWQVFVKPVNGEMHTVCYRATAHQNTFCFLPQVFRIKANTEKGEPRISIAMHTDDKDDFTKYRVSLAIKIAPYFHPNAKKDLYEKLSEESNGTILFPDLTLSGYKSARFVLDPAYSGENGVLRGKIDETIDAINPADGFTLSVECNLESFDFMKQELINGITIGHVMFDLEQTTDTNEEIIESEKIPVELSLKKLTNIQLHNKVIETETEFTEILNRINGSNAQENTDETTENDNKDKSDVLEQVLSEVLDFLKDYQKKDSEDSTEEENSEKVPTAPYGYILSNIHNQEIEIGGVSLSLLSKIGTEVHDVNLDINTINIDWPLNIKPKELMALVLNKEKIESLEGNNIWTHLQIEPYSIRFNKNPEAFINTIIDQATGDIETWNLTLDCGVFSNWNLLSDVDKAKYATISDIGVQIKKPSGDIQEVVLSKDEPEKILLMSTTLAEILNSQKISDRKYQLRQKNYYLTQEGEWSEWKDIEETSVNYKKIYPILD